MVIKWLKRYRVFLLGFILLCLLPLNASAELNIKLRAAYIKDGDLWIKTDNEDRRLTQTKAISSPSWSLDGSRIAYVKDEKDLWVYNVSNDAHSFIASGVHNIQWAPKQNKLAFQTESVLNVVDVMQDQTGPIQNTVLGVGNYAWRPSGDGFLVSSLAHLLPNGWTNVHLFYVYLNNDLTTKKVQRFITLPKTLTYNNVEVMVIGTSTFKWSKHGKWIAFIAHPTASLSADGNMLVAVSYNGKEIKPLGEILNYPRWFKWSPYTHTLASIQGSGREATANKTLIVQKPSSVYTRTFTPEGWVAIDMTWLSLNEMIVSRMRADGDNPSLYRINNKKQQVKVTFPPNGYGDFYPNYYARAKMLSWIRSNGNTAAVMLSEQNGRNAVAWIPKVDMVSDYYGFRDWTKVIDILNSH